jgi:putative ABC transport system permease protein
MGTLVQDLRYGLRMLVRKPGFTVIAIFTLALGTRASTAVFSVVNAVLLRSLPFPEAHRIIRVEEHHGTSGSRTLNLTYASFLDLGQETATLEHIGAARFWWANLTDGQEPERVSGLLVSAGYFSTLGAVPALGRVFLPEEDQPGRDNVVILSYGLWERRYGSDPNMIGRTIKAGSLSLTVVGVMPRGFRAGYPFPGEYDLWFPLAPSAGSRTNRRSHLLGVIARLKPGFTIEQAQAELTGIASRIEEQNPGVDPQMDFGVTRLQDRLVAPMRQALIVFLCAVGLLLLIACANAANLLLARAAAREREIAIRRALGAGRLRLARQLLTESTLLALLGGAAGLVLATWGVQLAAHLDPSSFPRINEANIDGRVLGFSLLTSLLVGVLFGLAPVLQLPKQAPYETLKDTAGGGTAGGRSWVRSTLVVSEIALALVLLTGAGLLINSFVRLLEVNCGFEPANVLTININLPSSKYPTGTQQTAILKEILERVSRAPDVRAAGLTSTLPFTGGPATDFEIEGRPQAEAGQTPIADIRIVDADYFRTLGIPLRDGRAFTERDTAAAPRVMIINEEMARRHWPGENPIGRRVTMKDWGPPLTGEIVGVVGDVKADGLDSLTRPMIYWPYPQFPGIFNSLVIRTDAEPLSVAAAVKSQLWSVDREQPLSQIQTMEEVIADSVAPRRFNMLLLTVFAALALALAAIGVYGVMAYTVAQSTREIGIRMALGARASDVLKVVLRQGLVLTLLGVGIGVAGALGLTRLMAALLYDVTATDVPTFVGVSMLLVLVSALACYLPGRRATKVDPMIALRYE